MLSWETKYSYTKFQNDGSKQWSPCRRDNQFKFISRIWHLHLCEDILQGK